MYLGITRMNDQNIANDKEFVAHKGYANNLTDKYLERRYESEYTTSRTQFIDLGLPSGTLWADRNIGAEAPEDYGDHFRWGETTPFTENSDDYEYRDLGENIAGTEYDAATSILGKGYKMPTHEQQKELIDCCTWEWSTVYGFKGMKVTGPNGNSIFLPAAGYRHYHSRSLDYVGLKGCYWSATPVFTDDGHYLEFDSDNRSCYGNSRSHGFTVRPVAAT